MQNKNNIHFCFTSSSLFALCPVSQATRVQKTFLDVLISLTSAIVSCSKDTFSKWLPFRVRKVHFQILNPNRVNFLSWFWSYETLVPPNLKYLKSVMKRRDFWYAQKIRIYKKLGFNSEGVISSTNSSVQI